MFVHILAKLRALFPITGQDIRRPEPTNMI